MSAACLFCRVVGGQSPAAVVLEDELTVAFLDHRPLFPGHCLVVPKAHHETLGSLPPALVGPLFESVRLVARAVEHGMRADGSFVALNNRVSQSVPHVHVHVVPRRQKDGLRGFFWPRQKYENEDALARTRDAIRAALLEPV